MVTEDTSQNTTPQTDGVDISLQAGAIAPVTDVAPVNTDTPLNSNPQKATAGDTPSGNPAGADAGVVGGVDTQEDPAAAYKAQKAAFLAGNTPPEQPPAIIPPADAAPAANPPASNDTPPAAPAADRLPKVPVRPTDQRDMDALQDWKANGGGKSLVEFILGQNAPAANPPAGQEPLAAPLPDGTEVKIGFGSISEVEAEMQRLVDLEYDAIANFDGDGAKKCRRAYEALRDQKLNIAAAESRAHEIQATAENHAWSEDLARAQRLYPEAGVEGSALEVKATEIRQQWINEGHPLAHSSRSAVAIYSEAALALDLAPSPQARPSAAPTNVSTPPATSIHRPPPGIIAGGEARSTQPRPVEVTKDNYLEHKAKLLNRR